MARAMIRTQGPTASPHCAEDASLPARPQASHSGFDPEEPVSQPLCASISSSAKWGNSTAVHRDAVRREGEDRWPLDTPEQTKASQTGSARPPRQDMCLSPFFLFALLHIFQESLVSTSLKNQQRKNEVLVHENVSLKPEEVATLL